MGSTRRVRAVSVDDWGKPIRDEQGKPICRWCRGIVVYPRRTFCSDACVHEWRIRSSPEYVREQVKKRDKGICRLCGVNVVKSRRKWEADHIVPVADGGGECGLENYRLLCKPCHLRVTLSWRASRARPKAAGPGRLDTRRANSTIPNASTPQGSPLAAADRLYRQPGDPINSP